MAAKKPTAVQTLTGQLNTFDKNVQNPVDVYNDALNSLGITDARTNVTQMRGALVNNQNLIDALPGNIQQRTADSIVTEAQRQRLQAAETAPLSQEGNRINQSLGLAQADLQDIMAQGDKQTDLTLQGQATQRAALMDRLQLAINNAKTAEEKKRWQAEFNRLKAQDKEQTRQFNANLAKAASSGGGGGGGGGSSSGSSKPNAYNDKGAILQDIKMTKPNNGYPPIGSDGYANPQSYNAAKRNYMQQGGSASSFDQVMGYLKNPQQKKNPKWEQYI